MARITSDRRRALRQRLLAFVSTREIISEETLAEQIDQLLEEVLEEDPLVAPLDLALDERDGNQRIVVTGMGLVTPFGGGHPAVLVGFGRSA